MIPPVHLEGGKEDPRENPRPEAIFHIARRQPRMHRLFCHRVTSHPSLTPRPRNHTYAARSTAVAIHNPICREITFVTATASLSHRGAILGIHRSADAPPNEDAAAEVNTSLQPIGFHTPAAHAVSPPAK